YASSPAKTRKPPPGRSRTERCRYLIGASCANWNISEQGLPPGSIIRFKEATYWEQHYRIIVTALSLCLLEALLIVALLVQLRRRRLAEAALRDSEERMSLAAEAANLGMWVWDVVRDEVWTTDKGRAMFGFAPDERLDSA